MFYSMFYSYNYSVIGNLLCNNFRWECTKLVFNQYYYFSHALCTHSWTSCMSRRAGKFHLHCDMQGASLSWISAAFTWYDSIPSCSYNTLQLLLWPFKWAAPLHGWCCGALYTAFAISPHAGLLLECNDYMCGWMFLLWQIMTSQSSHAELRKSPTKTCKMELLLRSLPTLLLKVLNVWKSWSVTKHTAIYSTDVFVEAPDNFIAHHW